MADKKPTPPDADQTGSDGYWIHDPGGPSGMSPDRAKRPATAAP